MKIVSINSELTESPNKVAFNLDQNPTDFELDQITTPKFYGSLIFEFKPGCVVVTTEPDEKQLKAENVYEINTKFSSVLKQEDEMKRKHDDMIKLVADLTELPIG